MSENKMVMSDKDTRIAPWGQRSEIREIARRVQLMAPGGKKLSENEALALAQGAVAHGLDPFNGEIWYIPGSGLMAGVKGLRKAARNQIDGNFWTEFDQINDPDDRNALMIPEGALAFRCILRDTETIMGYSKAWKDMAENGIPSEIIPTLIGKRPYVEGVGYLKRGEATRMDPVQCAMKRSEADALKRRFDLPFAIPSEPNGDAIDAEWVEVTEEEEQTEDLSKKAQEGIDTLFGADEVIENDLVDPEDLPHEKWDGRRPYPPHITRERILEKAPSFKRARKDEERPGGTLVTFIAWQMNECFKGDPKPDGKRIGVLSYIYQRPIKSANDCTGAELKAVEWWLGCGEHEGPGAGIFPRQEARAEAGAMFAAHLKEQGQKEIDL